jgi:hypothetical protein
VTRSYEERLDDLPRVAVPDWQLIRNLELLLRPYLPVMTSGRPNIFWAKDTEGTYDAASTDELRELAEKQIELPHTIRLHFTSADMYGRERSFNVYTSSEVGCGATFVNAEQAVIKELAEKVRDLFDGSALPSPQEQRTEQLTPGQGLAYAMREVTGVFDEAFDELAGPKGPSFFDRHGARIEKWALAIVPVIVAVLLTAWIIGK